MNEQPKNIWQEPWRGSKALIWFALLFAATFLIICGIGFLGSGNVGVVDTVLSALVIAGLISALTTLTMLFLRWLLCWRNFKRLLFGVACLLTLIALAYAVENVRGHYAWRAIQKAAEARGESFELASIIPPSVPDSENFAMAPLFEGLRHEMDTEYRRAHMGPGGLTNVNRFALTPYRTNGAPGNVPMGAWMKAEHTDLKTWQRYYRDPQWDGRLDSTKDVAERNAIAKRYGLGLTPTNTDQGHSVQVVNEFPTAPQPQSPTADVLLALSKYDLVVGELREAARRPRSRFPVRYEDTYTALLPHLARMKGASQYLALRSVAELDAGQAEAALDDVKLSLRLVDCIRGEPNLISHLVRIAQLHITLQPIWEGLADRRWNDAQLAALETELARIDFFPDYLTAMRGERVCSISAVDFVRRTRDVGIFSFDPGDATGLAKSTSTPLLMHLVPSGWFDQSKALMGRLHLGLFLLAVNQEAHTVSPKAAREAGEALDKALSRKTPYNVFAALLLPALTRSAEKFARGQTLADLARVACALERYRLAQGGYPEALDALAPRFLPKLPHDVINGRPLKYSRLDDGRFILYSVGWNETDDGGKVALTKSGAVDWDKGDLVWRYPAK